ncbi:MAG: hypothetical protein V4641_05505 [Pseudomonadota bacterium]
MSENTDKIEAQLRHLVADWLERAVLNVRHGPGASDFPMSVLLLASPQDAEAPIANYMLLCQATYPGRPDGWAQAMHTTRDMIALMIRMDNDFGLGLSLLPALAAQHPLFQAYVNNAPVVDGQPTPGSVH